MENANRDIKNNLNGKATIIGSLILVMAFIIIGISTSFAYYTNSIEQKNSENQSLTVNSGGLVMNFKTVDDKYINATAATLISDSDILNSNNYTEFSIEFPTAGNSATTGKYNIYLTQLKMTDNYIDGDVKWALYDASNQKVADGDFASATKKTGGSSTTETITLSNNKTETITLNEMNDIVILAPTTINRGNPTINYKLYVWLSSNQSKNQNGLLAGKLTGRVAFRGTTEK
ncbi:MAG: hypothetical protein NC483_05290 [Ruminococcus sp.]|nr:hypothetical protein [Ruminococcus sp.]